MPTNPDPNSPYLPARLEATFGVRAPGTPSMAGLPTPQAGDVSFPAPPSVNGAPAGRPPTTTGQPSAPTFDTTIPPPPPQAGMLGVAPTAPTPAGPAAPAAPAAPGGVIGALPRQPSASELPAGAAIQTPMGTASRNPVTGEQSVALSPEGQQRYREAVVAKREQLGPLPAVFRHPSLPEMPAEPGRLDFNPLLNRWVR